MWVSVSQKEKGAFIVMTALWGKHTLLLLDVDTLSWAFYSRECVCVLRKVKVCFTRANTKMCCLG